MCASSLPDVRCHGHRGLIHYFWGNKFWGAVFRVLSLVWCQLHSVAEITDPDLVAMGIGHEDIVRLEGKSIMITQMNTGGAQWSSL